MKVKVCGMREPENLAALLALQPEYVGFIFYEKSKRFIADSALATWITANQSAFGATKKVGVFVNAEVDYILNTVHDYQLDYVQLHGDESPGYCRELQLLWSVSTLRSAEIIKAFSITPDFDFKSTAPYADSCSLFVFDTGGHAEHGGTGQKWNWDKLAEYDGPVPFLLSGGIGPEDATAVRRIEHPRFVGVDLNSRFEKQPALKDITGLQLFMSEVNN